MSEKSTSISETATSTWYRFRSGVVIAICCLAAPCNAKAPTSTQSSGPAATSPQGKSASGSLKRATRFEDFNFEFEMPMQPWVQVKRQVTETSVLMTFLRSRPETYLSVLAQRMGISSSFNLEYAVADSKAHLKSETPDIEFLGDSKESANGLEGIIYKASVNTPKVKHYYVHWVGLRNGYAYQIRTHGPLWAADAVTSANHEFVRRFRQIEASEVAKRIDETPAPRFTSSTWGYQVDLHDLGWSEWKNMKGTFTCAEYGARQGSGLYLTVIPLAMPGRAPNIDVLLKSMAFCFKVQYPEDVVDVSSVQVGSLHGRQMQVRNTVNDCPVRYYMRVVADEHSAYFIAAWAESVTNCDTILKEGLDRVTITTRDVHREKDMNGQRAGMHRAVMKDLGDDAVGRGDYVAAADYFKAALEYGLPGKDTILVSYLEVLAELNRTGDGLAAFDLYSRFYERYEQQSPQLQAAHARLLAQSGQIYEAVIIYSKVFADGYNNEAELLRFAELAVRAKLIDEAIKAIDVVVERKPTLQLRRLQAALYFIKGDNAKAITLLTRLREEYPRHAGIAYDLASVHERSKNYDSALAITKLLVDSGIQDEETLLLHGRIQMDLQNFADAKKTFEHVQTLFPRSKLARELLEVASSQLGEGDNSLLKEPLDRVEIPPSVREAMDRVKASPATAVEEIGAEEVSRVIGIAYKANEPLRTTLVRRIKVYTQDGVARLSTLTFKLDQTREQLFVNRLVVFNEKDEQVAEGSVENYYIADETSSGMASNSKLVTLPVPGLKPGYTLECVVTRRDYAPSKDFSFRENVMSSNIPTDVSAFFIQGDVDRLKWSSSMPLDVQTTGNLLQCVVTNPPFYRSEVRQPPVNTFIPVLWVNAAKNSWDDEAQQYLSLIQDRLTVDDDTRKLAEELTRNCGTRREKIAAIANHVLQTTSYQAIEFGRRGVIPNAAAKTIKLKYGDCKDHALLTKQLLDSAGIPAHLALVKSTGEIAEALPAVKQFDHMVVYVPDDADTAGTNKIGGLVFDTTEKDADPLLNPPYGLSKKSIFVLDPQHPRIIRTPAYPPNSGKLVSRRCVKVRVDPADDSALEATVHEEVEFDAYLAPSMRAFVRHFEPAERRDAVQTLVSQHNKVRVQQLKVENLDRPAEPLRIELEYAMVDSLHSLDPANKKSFLGYFPSAWERQFVEADYLQKRDTPFEIMVPTSVLSTTRIEPPAGYQLVGLERYKSAGETEFVKWQSQVSSVDGAINVECRFDLAAGRHQSCEYQQYYSAMKKSLAPLRAPIMLDQTTLETAKAAEPRAR